VLTKLTLDDLDGGINLVDVGAAGQLGSTWAPLSRWLNVFAFEPNADSAEALRRSSHGYASLTVIPSAVADGRGARTLYHTRSPWNWSLLKPDTEWIRRFSYADLFEVVGTSEVETIGLSDASHLQGVPIDAIKCDSQGLEVPILRSAGDMLCSTFLIEAETGLVQNYCGETTFSELCRFLEDRGYLLFDLDFEHRIGRANALADVAPRKQPLWCESHWLRDVCDDSLVPTRGRALKSLLLCASLGALDYGFELAQHYAKHGLLSSDELIRLSEAESWRLSPPEPPPSRPQQSRLRRIAVTALSVIPARWLASGSRLMEQASRQSNPLRRLLPAGPRSEGLPGTAR
jgi:FkbM family methyltransferase